MKDTVWLKSMADYDTEAVVRGVEELFCSLEQGRDPMVPQGAKVLLKPNLLSKTAPEKAVTTHPEVVRGVIRACQKRGAGEIILADSAGGLYNPKQCQSLYQGTGMTQVAEEEGVTLYTDCQWEEVPCQGQKVSSFCILKPVLEADVIINLPKFKTHVMTGMTAAVKNMFGCIPGLEKSQWHTRFPQREDFGEMLLDLYEKIPPSFSILDGILAMEGDGPGGGNPRHLGLLMASENPILMDLAVAEMMGYQGREIPYLQAAMGRGYCGESFPRDCLGGETQLFAPIPQWVLPESYQGTVTADTTFSQFLPGVLQPVGRAIERHFAVRPVVLQEACIGCGKCSEICSKNAIVFRNQKAKILKNPCISCFCCHELCPVKAIGVKKSKLFQK